MAYAGDVFKRFARVQIEQQIPKRVVRRTGSEIFWQPDRERDVDVRLSIRERRDKRKREMTVENVLSRYRLLSCADTLVGGDSGGKK